jgi:hypothetical protein
MLARLFACPSCARHVRVTEDRCPFCGGRLPDSFPAGPEPWRAPPARGLGRAGLIRFGAMAAAGMIGGGGALATALTIGCGGVLTLDTGSDAMPDANSDEASTGARPPYGGSPTLDGAVQVFPAFDAEAGAPLDAASELTGDAGDAGRDGGGYCGPYGNPDGGPVICQPTQYCEINCATSGLCIRPSDAGTCPAGTIGDCPADDPMCPFEWYDGGCQFAASCSHLKADFCRVMQPPHLQADAATSRKADRSFAGSCSQVEGPFCRVMQPGSGSSNRAVRGFVPRTALAAVGRNPCPTGSYS